MIRRAFLITAAVAATLVPAGAAQAQSNDCPDCISHEQVVRAACQFVAEKINAYCVYDGRTAGTRSCSRPLGLTSQCLENIICGTPSAVARAAGLDEYGIDPTLNCIQ